MNQSRNLLLSVLFLGSLGVGLVHAQQAVRIASERPFEPAEELIYEAEFSRALLRKMDIADFKFSASRNPTSHPDTVLNAACVAIGASTLKRARFVTNVRMKDAPRRIRA